MEYRLFVYGTLRREEINHGLLGASRCESLLAWVAGSLVDTGRGYPAMTEGPVVPVTLDGRETVDAVTWIVVDRESQRAPSRE